jgi:DNA-binding SARP family transcriptional activator
MDGDRATAVGKGNERALIALLALHANTVVSTGRIIDALWGEQPPATARDMVRLYVSRARTRIGDRLVTEGTGYRLRTENGEVDVAELERLRRTGTEAMAAGDAAAAAAYLGEAIGLARGEPLAEFEEFPFAREEILRLDELRLGTTEDYYDARLAAGDSTELVAALEHLVEENPYRERLRGQLMLALYRAGRQTDALARYQEGRRLLADEVGIEPSPRLRELERSILQHDPGLVPDRRTTPEARRSADSPPRSHRRLVLAVLAVLVLGAAIAALVVTQTGGHSGLTSLPPNSVGSIDPVTYEIKSAVRLPGDPLDLTADAGRVWVAMGEPHGMVGEIDPTSSNRLAKRIRLGVVPRRIGPGSGGVWIAGDYGGTITRLDAATGRPGTPQSPFPIGTGVRISFAGGPGTLWVAGDTADEAAKLDPHTGRVLGRVRGLDGPVAIARDFGALWLASSKQNVVQRARGAAIHAIQIGWQAVAVTTGARAVLALSQSGGRLYRIDPRHLDVVKTIAVGTYPTSVAFGHGSVWVASQQSGTVLRVDPRIDKGRVVKRIRVGRPVWALSYYDGRLWVAVH